MAEIKLIKKDGVVSMDRSFDALCSTLPNGEYTVRIVRKTKPRSIPQNSLMWMWFQCMEDNLGQDKEDFHEHYKAKFLMRDVNVSGKWIRVPGSTKKLTTEQMSIYMDKIKLDALYEFGITLPLPEDRYYQDFVDEYKNK